MKKLFSFAVSLILVFPIIVPELDDRAIACVQTGVKEGGLNDFIHQLPAPHKLDRESGHVVFGDGERGRIPNTNSKHEETQGHIVFADGNQGVIINLCGDVPVPQ